MSTTINSCTFVCINCHDICPSLRHPTKGMNQAHSRLKKNYNRCYKKSYAGHFIHHTSSASRFHKLYSQLNIFYNKDKWCLCCQSVGRYVLITVTNIHQLIVLAKFINTFLYSVENVYKYFLYSRTSE